MVCILFIVINKVMSEKKTMEAFEWLISTIPDIQNIVLCYLVCNLTETRESNVKQSRVQWKDRKLWNDRNLAEEWMIPRNIPTNKCSYSVDSGIYGQCGLRITRIVGWHDLAQFHLCYCPRHYVALNEQEKRKRQNL